MFIPKSTGTGSVNADQPADDGIYRNDVTDRTPGASRIGLSL